MGPPSLVLGVERLPNMDRWKKLNDYRPEQLERVPGKLKKAKSRTYAPPEDDEVDIGSAQPPTRHAVL